MGSKATKTSILTSKWIIRIASVVGVLIAWQVYGTYNPFLISSPTAIGAALIDLTVSTPFVSYLAITLWTAFVGYAIAAMVGIAIGAGMARWQTIDNAIDPYVTMLYNAPYVALAPLFMIFFGVDFLARVIVVILSVAFVVIINSVTGFKTASKALVETGRSFGFSGPILYTKLVVPAALPYIMTGMRLGVARALVGILVAESVVQIVYTGYQIQYYAESTFQIDHEMAIVIVIAVLGLVLTEVLKYAEHALSKWRVATTML